MRVICVNDETWHPTKFSHEIKIGDVVEVIDTKVNYDYLHYLIKGYEYKNGKKQWYYSGNFAPISEIDETEFERNYNLQPCTEQPHI